MLNKSEITAMDIIAKNLHLCILNLEKVRAGSVPLLPTRPILPAKAAPVVVAGKAPKLAKGPVTVHDVANALKAPVRQIGALAARKAPMDVPAKAAPVTVAKVAKVKVPKQGAVVQALLHKKGISHAALNSLLGWPVGATYLDRISARNGIAWWITGNSTADRRYFGRRVSK